MTAARYHLLVALTLIAAGCDPAPPTGADRAETPAGLPAVPQVPKAPESPQARINQALKGSEPPPAEKSPAFSAKTREIVANLKSELTAFEVHLYTHDIRKAGGPGAESDAIRLVTDETRVPAKGKGVFAITEKQAVAVIDYLAGSRMFDNIPIPPPGIAAPAWYFGVSGGKPAAGQTQGRIYQWPHSLDTPPATVAVMKFLAKTLQGDARTAVENFRKDVPKAKG